MDINQLVTAKEAAKLKRFKSTNAFAHHVRNKPGTPQPIIFHGIQFWDKEKLLAWNPNHKRGPEQKGDGADLDSPPTQGDYNGKKRS